MGLTEAKPMSELRDETVYTRYLRLHAQWAKEDESREHLDALPMLMLADTIERQCHQIETVLKQIIERLPPKPTLL
jgi:hypothetical protein